MSQFNCGGDTISFQDRWGGSTGSLLSPRKINPEQDPSDAEAGRRKCHQGEIAIHSNPIPLSFQLCAPLAQAISLLGQMTISPNLTAYTCPNLVKPNA
jgi:hypothetical protein